MISFFIIELIEPCLFVVVPLPQLDQLLRRPVAAPSSGSDQASMEAFDKLLAAFTDVRGLLERNFPSLR